MEKIIRCGEVDAMIKAIQDNDNKVIDDHDKKLKRVSHFAIFQNREEQEFVFLPHSQEFKDWEYCSVNVLYLDQDGIPHLSRKSIGGVIQAKHGSLEQAVQQYNDGLPGDFPMKFKTMVDVDNHHHQLHMRQNRWANLHVLSGRVI
jgi:hypothetical protein